MKITNVKHLVWQLGGNLWVAYNLNVHQITICRWVKKNAIPEKYRLPILTLAESKGISSKDVEKLLTTNN